MNRHGSEIPYEERLKLLNQLERRRVRQPDESIREACRAIDPKRPEALRSMFRRRGATQESIRLRAARQELNVDVAAVLNGMSDGELNRLAENVRRELEVRGIEELLEASGDDWSWLDAVIKVRRDANSDS